jgi:hypothetical protein
MRERILTEFASCQTTVCRFLAEYGSWMCSTLGCRMEEAVLTKGKPAQPVKGPAQRKDEGEASKKTFGEKCREPQYAYCRSELARRLPQIQ